METSQRQCEGKALHPVVHHLRLHLLQTPTQGGVSAETQGNWHWHWLWLRFRQWQRIGIGQRIRSSTAASSKDVGLVLRSC